MNGPYDFTSEQIDKVVDEKKLGNYALGRIKESGGSNLTVHWVGRSDTDLNKELKARLNLKYPKFKFSYADSKQAAFEKECRNYHDFGGKEALDNKIHPDRPDGMDKLKCPVSGCTELQPV
jgi:hypothetical protein